MTKFGQCLCQTMVYLEYFLLLIPTAICAPIRMCSTGKFTCSEHYAMTIDSKRYSMLLLSYKYTVMCDPFNFSLRSINTSQGNFIVTKSINETTRRFIAWVYRSYSTITAGKWMVCCKIFGIDYIPKHEILHNEQVATINIDFKSEKITIFNQTTNKTYELNIYSTSKINAATILLTMRDETPPKLSKIPILKRLKKKKTTAIVYNKLDNATEEENESTKYTEPILNNTQMDDLAPKNEDFIQVLPLNVEENDQN